ncbi:MAG TPA: phosphoglycerate mutase [Dehalococcoidia bacterium]|jgi:2,3-bisphosphoglycerate-independent phosphoglycerate mutase|nr:phosphoglycerate mutase [Dehalococcoidia bacterium]
MRILLIIFDGLADRPAPELEGKTPLEAAQSPNLDRLAAEGINGLLHPKSPGYPLGSPLALHLMFGYPEDEFPDRGPLLATARGIEIAPGDVVLAARFACVEPQPNGRLRLLQRFVRGREEECTALAAAIAHHQIDGLTFRYTYSGRGDGILIITGGASYEVTDTDPLGLDLPVLKSQSWADAAAPANATRTAAALNSYLRWAYSRFTGSVPRQANDGPPVNFLITKWAGPKPSYEPFAQRWGMRGASLPDEEVVSGLMLELGFHLEQITGADPESDLRRRLARARDLLAEGYQFIHLHSKYPDPMSHDNEPLRVRDAIEALDAGMEAYWSDLAADPDLITVLTTDHTTPSVWANHPRGQFSDQHSGEEVPLAIRGGNLRVDAVSRFDERSAVAGALGHLRGEDFMPVLLTAAERANMWEMRPTPDKRLYRPRPEEIEPFRLPSGTSQIGL